MILPRTSSGEDCHIPAPERYHPHTPLLRWKVNVPAFIPRRIVERLQPYVPLEVDAQVSGFRVYGYFADLLIRHQRVGVRFSIRRGGKSELLAVVLISEGNSAIRHNAPRHPKRDTSATF